ncbi:hypothetical protein ANO11243_021680 [Dothideomycetidae sp. 11243]|nr:hypothetical protein ANO11243_021680 [fungal sp. No.11243]
MTDTNTTPFIGLPVIPSNDPSLTTTTPIPRKVQHILYANEQSEGAGATVRRTIGSRRLDSFTPFLLFDHFSIGPGAGFPDHPHRGQETITYILSGAVEHEDFTGQRGVINAGDLQFMTAGRGIVHAEMPSASPSGTPNVGVQIWVDLPAALKDCEPRYRDLRADEVPLAESADGLVEVKVISGRAYGVDGQAELAYTPVWLLDVTLRPGGVLEQRLPSGWHALAYTLSGHVTFNDSDAVGPNNAVILSTEGDILLASSTELENQVRFLVLAGSPLDQPIVRRGPFVATKREGLVKAVEDFYSFSNGFERARNWESEIGKVMMH